MQISKLVFVPPQTKSTVESNHSASVTVLSDGTLSTHIDTIITPGGNKKNVKYVSIKPSEQERVMSTRQVPQLFEDLQHVNVILTNACNLSCSYCYEQHNKDYGRFTTSSLKQIYDFLAGCSSSDGKVFQFFGGEPLIHKALILNFVSEYAVELERNAPLVHVSMITNGILLTSEFISSYFAYSFTGMSISLDTIDASVDHREIGQDNINHILNMISLIPAFHKENHRVSVRCTIAVENAPYIKILADELYHRGLRSLVIHPLTMSSRDGTVGWPTDQWNELHANILDIIRTYPGFAIQFSEGVGIKKSNNCMVGSDMIAVDGSGDYSGCYFFTNQKESSSHTILGNLLTDSVYVDRYLHFQDAYNEMFVKEDQCKSCNLKGFCYQCPAGNADTGTGQLFRPDAMCQSIVKLFIDLQDDIVKKAFNQKVQELITAVAVQGEQFIFKKSIIHLMYKHITGHHLPVGSIDELVDTLPMYEQLLSTFLALIVDNTTELPPPYLFLPTVDRLTTPISIKTFYEELMERKGKPTVVSKTEGGVDDTNKRVFYLALIHMVVLNIKGDRLNDQTKIIRI